MKNEKIPQVVENAILVNSVDIHAIVETIIFVAEKCGLKGLEVMEFFNAQQKRSKDSLLRYVENVDPGLAAQNDERNIDEVPTDD